MNSFISYFKKSPALFIAIALIVSIETILHFIPNLHYIEGGGAFLTTYKRLIAEKGKDDFDYLMFGDSRSLSILGKKRTVENKFSMYNFSLPAAGPRYFRFYLKKYLRHHKKPEGVIWAVDPEQLQPQKGLSFNSDKALWTQYKHRLLNLFSVVENVEQYSGRELFFIMKESAPNLMYSVKYREGLEKLFSGFVLQNFKQYELPNVRRNLLIESMMNKTNGQINLGNYFFAPEDASVQNMKSYIANMQKTDYTILPLREFLEYCKLESMPVIVLDIPHATGLNDTPYYKTTINAITNEVKNYPNAVYLSFPEVDYDPKLFSESIHYNSKGEKKVNEEFDKFIWPKVLSFARQKL